MRFIEFGKENREVICLLHGGGLSWWNYREVALLLQDEYRVILPVLDGHAGSDKDFTTIESCAADIIRFIDENLGGQVLLLGGLSLGGQVALEILSQRSRICRFAIIESASVIPSKLTHAMIAPAFGSCYGLVRHKWFSKLQHRSLHIKEELFDDYFRDSAAITKSNMIAFLQQSALYAPKASLSDCGTAVHLFVGQREPHSVRASAEMLHKLLPHSRLQFLKGLYHGEFSINHAADYFRTLRQIVTER